MCLQTSEKSQAVMEPTLTAVFWVEEGEVELEGDG